MLVTVFTISGYSNEYQETEVLFIWLFGSNDFNLTLLPFLCVYLLVDKTASWIPQNYFYLKCFVSLMGAQCVAVFGL